MMRYPLIALLFAAGCFFTQPTFAQDASSGGDGASAGPVRASIVEDRAARKLLEAGDARYDANEQAKAIEVWRAVIERYPRSRVRFDAHMRLGKHLLEKDRAYDQARTHFEAAADEDNTDEALRADATLQAGVCHYEARNFGKTFQVMRDVIERFPTSGQVNQAYYYIGLSHFQLGHYSRAIQALERVGTALGEGDKGQDKAEAGKRLFIKIQDADLAALEPGETVKVQAVATSGDREVIEGIPVGRNVRIVLGSIQTDLGRPRPGNGVLEVRGGDTIEVTYIDRHTADRQFDQPRVRTITVVGNAIVQITDGAYLEPLAGVVLGKHVNVQVTDADFDRTDDADTLQASVEVWRPKTPEEIEQELADLIAKGAIQAPADGEPLSVAQLDAEDAPQIDRFKKIDAVTVTLTEASLPRRRTSDRIGADPIAPDAGGAAPAPSSINGQPSPPPEPTNPADAPAGNAEVDDFARSVEADAVDTSIHTGVFRAAVALEKAEQADPNDDRLQALPGDWIRLVYIDELHVGDEPRRLQAQAKAVEGNLGGVRVTRAEISDEELRLQTRLKTAGALTQIGNRYKEFGLADRAQKKYDEALEVCEEIVDDARRLGGRILEETYVQLWRIYFEMDKLNLAAAMAGRLQQEFPNSGFVDEAMLQLGRIAQKKNDYRRAISVYTRLVGLKTSGLRGEAQFGIAECYEAMAAAAGSGPGSGSEQLYERAFQEYKKVFDQHPESGRVGEAVAKMANFYYQKQDYSRAIDVFETVLTDHPDARFLDVILFNYGRCLYRMERRAEARRKFDQLIGEFPESALAADAKRISDALVKGGF